ncbi:MAG: zinc-dependent metalloprotease, partial [Solirubrobacteraceae bacterium]
MDTIDWGLAQRVGELLAGTPSYEQLPTDSVSTLSKDFAARVSAYAELQAPAALPSLEVIDRPRWIEANLKSMRPLLEGVTPRLGQDLGALSSVMGSASSFLLGVQVGAIAGMLSQRVLGQYDVALLDAERQPRLLLVAPNLDKAANDLDVDPEQLIAWVAIHEITHAIQFAGAPWLREHLAGILTQLIESLQVSASMGELLEMIRA